MNKNNFYFTEKYKINIKSWKLKQKLNIRELRQGKLDW